MLNESQVHTIVVIPPDETTIRGRVSLLLINQLALNDSTVINVIDIRRILLIWCKTIGQIFTGMQNDRPSASLIDVVVDFPCW